MSHGDAERDIVAEGVFLALFRVVEIEELYGPEKAVEWAQSMVEDDDFRRSFSASVLAKRAARVQDPPTD